MAIRVLPTFAGLYHYGYLVDLDRDGVRRRVEIRHNPRDTQGTTDGAWYLDLLSIDGTALVRGVKLALGRNKLARYKYREGMPAGDLHVVDSSGQGHECGRDELGARVVLQWEVPEP
jgi:hypothetical protein